MIRFNGFFASSRIFAKDIHLAHTVFALPFALSVFWLLNLPYPSWLVFLKLIVCMVMARSFAMGINRLADREIDKLNPRTENRAIPSGKLSILEAYLWSAFTAVVFVLSSFFLNLTSGVLSIVILFLLGGYSYIKRFSCLSHFYLGFCLALTPNAISIALGSGTPLVLWVLGAGILCWVSGFDIIYALQDEKFDSMHHLYSLPVCLGRKRALKISQICFLFTVLAFVLTGILASQKGFYYVGMFIIAMILLSEHRRLKQEALSPESIQFVFFSANSYVSLLYFVSCVVDDAFS